MARLLPNVVENVWKYVKTVRNSDADQEIADFQKSPFS